MNGNRHKTLSVVIALCVFCLIFGGAFFVVFFSVNELLRTPLSFNDKVVREYEARVRAYTKPILLCPSTNNDAGYARWVTTAALWGVRGEPLGRGRVWRGSGMKLNLLRVKLKELIDAQRFEDIVLYTDSSDVMFVGPIKDVVSLFIARGSTRVLFAADAFCPPDDALCNQFERVAKGYSYLNPGVIIGYVSTLYELVKAFTVADSEDDRPYYEKAYLNSEIRETLQLGLDHRAEIFQCLGGNALDHVRVVSEPNAWPFVENTFTRTRPLVIHGNGPEKYKQALTAIEDKLVRGWTSHSHLAVANRVEPRALAKFSRSIYLT